jgi:hypothetical protein
MGKHLNPRKSRQEKIDTSKSYGWREQAELPPTDREIAMATEDEKRIGLYVRSPIGPISSCPFCGSKAEFEIRVPCRDMQIRCMSDEGFCGAVMREVEGSMEYLVMRWNSRYKPRKIAVRDMKEVLQVGIEGREQKRLGHNFIPDLQELEQDLEQQTNKGETYGMQQAQLHGDGGMHEVSSRGGGGAGVEAGEDEGECDSEGGGEGESP